MHPSFQSIRKNAAILASTGIAALFARLLPFGSSRLLLL